MPVLSHFVRHKDVFSSFFGIRFITYRKMTIVVLHIMIKQCFKKTFRFTLSFYKTNPLGTQININLNFFRDNIVSFGLCLINSK